MTTETFKELAQRLIPSSAAAVYTATAVTTLIRHITITNNTGADATVRLYHHDAAGANTDTTTILPALPVVAGGMAEFTGVMSFDSGDVLEAVSGTNNALNITVEGVELV